MKVRTLGGTTSPEIQPYETEHRKVARAAAADSIVLLKNENQLLPVACGTPVALYGAGAGHTVKGGTGSGDVNERYSVTIAEGLRQAGYPLTTEDWLEDYDRKYTQARQAWKDAIWAEADKDQTDAMSLFQVYSGMPFSLPAGSIPTVKTAADTAVYVLSRISGEGADRYYRPGDYLLSDEEEQLIDAVCSLYPQVVLVLNCGGQVDLSFTDRHPNILSILQISQLGCEGGNGFADVFSGRTVPSGKLAATWAYHYEDYPSSASFSHNDGNTDKEYYEEGIYVGYRYFDSFEIPVRYGFGYGLSYTEFSHGKAELTLEKGQDTQICVSVPVTNTGHQYSGREAVEVYASSPQQTQDAEYRRLAGFAKTDVLAPGQTQTVTVRFSPYDLSSYSENDSGWLLEAGIYGIFEGTSLQESRLIGTVQVGCGRLLVQTGHICPLKAPMKELAGPSSLIRARRAVWMAEKDNYPAVFLTDDDLSSQIISYGGEYERIPEQVRDFVDSLSEDQLIRLSTGSVHHGSLASELGSAGISVPGSAAQSSDCAIDRGLPDIAFADGPAGLRLNKNYYVKDGKPVREPFEKSLEGGFLMRGESEPDGEEHYQYCTAFPVGTALAQSWDPDLIAQVGRAVGEEMQLMQVTAWLAPGMNIQRNPLCGRNFEYYSEDPLLTGKMAAGITRGVQSNPGCGTCVKHFACNNQEDNRMFSDSIVSERALREIYLKGFEIAVRQAQPMMIMTSYNLINGVHSANNYDICSKAARDEWGFKGLIITDWTTTHNGPDCTAAGCMRAGNDMVMPGRSEDHENIRQALEDGTLDIQDLKRSVCHLVNVIWQSNMM